MSDIDRFGSPIPTQTVASDEYLPAPQTEQQRHVEARLKEMGRVLAGRLGMSRRQFFRTASGMAASYLVMNQVYGPLFAVSEAEARTPELAQARADELKDQLVFDAHTHFLSDNPSPAFVDPSRTGNLMWQRALLSRLGWNKDLAGRDVTVEDLKVDNFLKEIYLDSDTKVALLSNAPSTADADWLLPQEQVFKTREKVNGEAGSKRMLAHYTITPGRPGWLEGVDRAIEVLKPDGWKAYTIGDVILANGGRGAYRLDDEKLMYPFYEKVAKAGIKAVCVHKGLFPLQAEARLPQLAPYANVGDVGRAAKDWPQLDFAIYHSGYRHLGGAPADGMTEWEQHGRLSWLSDLAEIPAKHGVTNVYADLGSIFAWTVIAQPRLAAAMMGDADQRAGRRPCDLGHRCGMDGLAAMADRGLAPAGDSRRHAAPARLRAARRGRWSGQESDLRRHRPAPVGLSAPGQPGQARPLRRNEDAV